MQREISLVTGLTDAGLGVVVEYPVGWAEAMRLAEVLIDDDTAEIATAAADRRDDEGLARSRARALVVRDVQQIRGSVRVTALAVARIRVARVAAYVTKRFDKAFYKSWNMDSSAYFPISALWFHQFYSTFVVSEKIPRRM